MYKTTGCAAYGTHYFDWYIPTQTTQDKYTLTRDSGTTIATLSDKDYHQTTCSDKCFENKLCKEFTVLANGDCVLYDKCHSLASTGTVVSDHYKRADCELINKCDLDPNTITIPTNGGWKKTNLNESPTRKETAITIPSFDFSNKDCGLMFYELKNYDKKEV